MLLLSIYPTYLIIFTIKSCVPELQTDAVCVLRMLWRVFLQVSNCYQCFVRCNFSSHLVVLLSAGCSPLCHMVPVRCVSAFMWSSCNCCQACTQPYFIPRIQDQLAYSKRGECTCVSVAMEDSVENVFCFRSLTAQKSRAVRLFHQEFSHCFSSSVSHLFHQIKL